MDLQMRDECKNLLSQLRLSQKSMKDKLQITTSPLSQDECYNVSREDLLVSNFGKDITGQVNVSKDADTDLKPTYARNKLLSLSKSKPSGDSVYDMNATYLRDKENKCKSDIDGNSDFNVNAYSKLLRDMSSDLNFDKAVSPTRMKKRQLIDKHTAVETKLNPKELKELEDERLLNFNYSNINVDQSYGVKSLTNVENNKDSCMKEKFLKEPEVVAQSAPSVSFQSHLQDEGNDRRFRNWVKETSIKPKSLLNSTDYYNLSKRGISSRGRFNSTSNEEVSMGGDPRLLGYDWIAALMDNEQSMVDQSESFFDEICDFRKAFKNECNNQFYNESPYTLVDREPEPVVEALTDPKVRPFVVNDRLFTEPLTTDLIEDSCDKDGKSAMKEPSKDNPRFVRVSIPRSTLQTPHRVKPHRRGSFDGSDSCALMDHCLLGWENTVPSSMPPAKSLSLATDAGTQINSQTTTLAEAERQATTHNQTQWHLSRPSAHSHILPRWRKHYMDTTLNLTLPSAASQQSRNANTSAATTTFMNGSSSASGGRGGDAKRSTDRILQATYSTMYEMERLRLQRELGKEKDS